LVTLENPDAASVMKAKPPMRLDFLRWIKGEWVPATKESDGVTTVYDVDEKIGFRVKKAFEKDLFLTLLDLDPTGSVIRVWPNTTVSALTGSTSFDIVPGPTDGDWTMSWPDGEPMESLVSSDATSEYVEENWILIVTMQQADFKDYQQAGTQARRAPADESAMRAMKMGPPKIDDDWGVVRQTLKVRRRKPS
jgi:hypothetical protein